MYLLFVLVSLKTGNVLFVLKWFNPQNKGKLKNDIDKKSFNRQEKAILLNENEENTE